MRSQLTDVTVRSLKPVEGQQIKVWDTKTPGFGVRVNGRTKSFIVMYGPKRQLKVLGRYPDTSLSEARRRALVLLGTRPSLNTAPPFQEALEYFLEVRGATLKPRSKREIERTLRRYFEPAFKTRTLDKITHSEVASIIDAIVEKPSEALHAFKDIRTFFRWTVPRYLPHSPIEGMKPPGKYTPRKRVLSAFELKALWDAVPVYPFGTIIRILLLTGQRWGEIVSLRREYIDEYQKIITLPETKNGRTHVFPYGNMVVDILATVPCFKASTLLFPGRDKQKPWNGAGKAKWELDKDLKLDPWTIHDLRRTFATIHASIGTPIHITERLLNHVSGTQAGIVSVYQRHEYLPEMRKAVDAFEAHLKSILRS
jgi:integrase